MSEQRIEETISAQADEMEIDLIELLGDFIRLLVRFWWIILLFIVLSVGAVTGYTVLKYSPMYECKATFTVGTGNGESGSYGFYYSQNSAEQLSKTFPYILESGYFRSVLLEQLGASSLNGTISAETITDSNMVTMKVVSGSKEDAKKILETALEIYPNTAQYILGNIEFHMIDEPETPSVPYNKPNIPKLVIVGGMLGVALAAGALALLAILRKTAKSPETMKRITSLKCLASVPDVKAKARRNAKQKKIRLLDPRIPHDYKESIRALRMRIERNKRPGEKVLMITSTMPGEGKTTIAVNLAEALAEKGKKVLLIDADLRKQGVVKMLGCENRIGLREICDSDREILLANPLEEEKFWLVGGDTEEKRPERILSSPQMSAFIERMKDSMDYIIIDTPPCGSFQDAVILEEYADCVLYVVRYDYVPEKKILEGLSFLQEEKVHFLGYVFNGCGQGGGHYGRYGYGYGRYGYGRYGYGGYGYGSYGRRNNKEEKQTI